MGVSEEFHERSLRENKVFPGVVVFVILLLLFFFCYLVLCTWQSVDRNFPVDCVFTDMMVGE